MNNYEFINKYYEWHKLYHEVIHDNKIHVLTNKTYKQDNYYHFFVIPDVGGQIITIFYSLPSAKANEWEEEIVLQKLVSNVVESLCLVNKNIDILFLASSNGTYYGSKIENNHKKQLKLYLQNNNQEILNKASLQLQNHEMAFSKFTKTESFIDGSVQVIRYFLTTLFNQSNVSEAILIRTKNLTSRMLNLDLLNSDKMLLQTVLASGSEGIYGVDLLGECTFANTACLRHLGYNSQEEIIGHNMHVLLHHHDVKGKLLLYEDSRIKNVLQSGKQSMREEQIIWKKDGSFFLAECYYYPLYNEGVLVGAIATFYDISEANKYLKDYLESERSKTYLLSNLPGMAYRCRFDQDWTMLFVSEGVYDLLEYSPEELINNKKISYNEIILPSYRSFIWDKYNEILLLKQKFREEYKITTKSGKEKWVLELGRGVYDDNMEVIALEGIIIDITEQKEREQEAEYLNKYDKLTNTFNRLYFEELIEKYHQSEYLPLAYMVGDINGLHLINDTYGKEYGNNYLLETIQIIKDNIPNNSIVARTGGDEFSILIPNTPHEITYEIYKKIIDAFKTYNYLRDKTLPEISISFGFEVSDNLEKDFSIIIKTANEYMKRRKLLCKKSLQNSLLSSIKSTMYERSQETEEHADRLNLLTNKLGIALDLSQPKLDLLAIFSIFHDIGKVGISDNILKKPGKLTLEEWDEMKRHPIIGHRICSSSTELMAIADLVLCHHERWDGKGYPNGLKGEDIPLLARILAVVDAYDSMTNDRIYRPALTASFALNEIKLNANTQFDPFIVEKFVNIMENNNYDNA